MCRVFCFSSLLPKNVAFQLIGAVLEDDVDFSGLQVISRVTFSLKSLYDVEAKNKCCELQLMHNIYWILKI